MPFTCVGGPNETLKWCDALSVAVFARMEVLEDESTQKILEKLRNRRLRDLMR